MKIKTVFKYQPDIKRLRLFRVIWADGYKCLSLSLEPRLFQKAEDWTSTSLTVLGLRVTSKKANGGRFV